MEREYLVSFIITLIVILIVGTIAYIYFPKVWKDVSDIAEDVFSIGAEKKKIEATQLVFKTLMESLEKCQKQQATKCMCQIDNKEKLPEGFRIMFKIEYEGGIPQIVVYAFSKEDKIIPIKPDVQGLKLQDLKLGVAYWGKCIGDSCSEPLFGKGSGISDAPDSETQAELDNDIFCVYSSAATGKDMPIMIMGDSDNDWAVRMQGKNGFFFDQMASKPKYQEIGNILKISDKEFCLVTSHLLRYDSSYKAPQFDKKDDVFNILGGRCLDQRCRNRDDVVEITMANFPRTKCGVGAVDIQKWQKACEDMKYALRWPIIGSQELRETCEKERPFGWPILDRTKFKVACGSTDKGEPFYFPQLFHGKVTKICEKDCSTVLGKINHKLVEMVSYDPVDVITKCDMSGITPNVEPPKDKTSGGITAWIRTSTGSKSYAAYLKVLDSESETQQRCPGLKPKIELDYELSLIHKDVVSRVGAWIRPNQLIGFSPLVSGDKTYWFDRMEVSSDTSVHATTLSHVWDVCDERCGAGEKYIILYNHIENFSSLAYPHNISRMMFYGNLATIDSKVKKKGAEVKLGQTIGTIKGSAWLNYTVTYNDYDKNGRLIWARSASPYLKLSRLPTNNYKNCGGENGIKEAIILEQKLGADYIKDEFDLKSAKFNLPKASIEDELNDKKIKNINNDPRIKYRLPTPTIKPLSLT